MPTEENVTRKLRAILSADVKGYSLLMSDDEAFTVKTLKSYREVMSAQIVRHKGRVVDTPGDNLLAEFASVVDAVQCAVEIQKLLKKKNEALPPDKRLEFRIGVNIGDVIQDGNNIYGSGVNVAARIEGLSDAGGICLSRNAYNHVKDKLNYGYEYLGEHEVKNIKDPIRVYKVLISPKDAGKLISEKKKTSKLKLSLIGIAAFIMIVAGVLGGLYWWYLYLPAPADIDSENMMTLDLPKGPSIAVLPFDNMTGDPEQIYFCDGFTENLISTLSYTKKIVVISRNSSFEYRGKQINIQKIGKELNAEWIIEGSVQKAKDHIRITVQLINAITGIHKWAETYDRKFIELFKIQDEIAQEIAKAIGIEILWGGAAKNAYDGIESMQEYKMLSEAISEWYLDTQEGAYKAREILLELIERNKTIPVAYTILSSTYIQSMWFDKASSKPLYIAKAFAACKKALSLNKDFDKAHTTAGLLYMHLGEYDKAINSYKIAISLNPNNAIAYSGLGEILIFHGRPEEAIVQIKKAQSLNPIEHYSVYFLLGFAYQDMGEYEKAVNFYTKSLSLHPDYWSAYIGLVIVYGHMGDLEKAKEAIDELFRLNPDFSASDFLKTMSYKHESSRDFLREGIQKAGLQIDE